MGKPFYSETDGRGLSAQLWGNFPTEDILFRQDPSAGVGLFDDFTGFGASDALSTSTQRFQSNGISYLAYNDTTVVPVVPAVPTTTPSVSANGPSVIAIQPDATDNDSAILMAGGGTMCPFNVIYATAGDLVFETRIKISAITGGEDIFIGLGGTGACANNGVRADNSGVLASNDFLGFTRLATGTSSLTFTYQRVSGTEATHTGMHTMVADTYFKAGFRFHQSTKACTVWINGVKVHTVTASETYLTPWPTLFMTFLAEVKYQTAASVLNVDWWACAQASA